MLRRHFLASLAAAPLAAQKTWPGAVLVHEHVLVDFKHGTAQYSPDEVFAIAKPHLDAVKKLGVVRFQDCTPNYLGRNPKLLARLADATGLDIWTNTGLYAARNHQYLPPFAKTETPEQIAKRWVTEAREGVDGMKPRFIKIGVNRGKPLPDLDRKIVRAAALCSLDTGLTIQSHTGDGAAALDQLDIVTAAKLPPAKFVWVHAYNEKDHAIHERVAGAGAWVQLDGVGPKSVDWHLECVRFLQSKKLLHRTLISHDAGYYRPGEPKGGVFRPYTTLFTDVLPKLDEATARQLVIENPRAAYGK